MHLFPHLLALYSVLSQLNLFPNFLSFSTIVCLYDYSLFLLMFKDTLLFLFAEDKWMNSMLHFFHSRHFGILSVSFKCPKTAFNCVEESRSNAPRGVSFLCLTALLSISFCLTSFRLHLRFEQQRINRMEKILVEWTNPERGSLVLLLPSQVPFRSNWVQLCDCE